MHDNSSYVDDLEDDNPPPIYDTAVPDDDPWAPSLSDSDERRPPLPRADCRPLIDPEAWRKAQGDCAEAMARAAMAVGRLDELVGAMGQGAIDRLALRETEELLWATGTPVPADELARDLVDARAGTDLPALQQGRWAVRRLVGQGDARDVRGFLGLHRTEPGNERVEGISSRLRGPDFDVAAAEFLAVMTEMQDLHPIARGGFARSAWMFTDLSREDDVLEGAIWSARIMAEDCSSLPFVPFGRAGRRFLRHGGSPQERLRNQCIAVLEAAAAARTTLLRLKDWVERAETMTAQIKGDNPKKIIAALIRHPLALTATLEASAGVSRDTAERILARMKKMGIVREITGTRRFRIWSADLIKQARAGHHGDDPRQPHHTTEHYPRGAR